MCAQVAYTVAHTSLHGAPAISRRDAALHVTVDGGNLAPLSTG